MDAPDRAVPSCWNDGRVRSSRYRDDKESSGNDGKLNDVVGRPPLRWPSHNTNKDHKNGQYEVGDIVSVPTKGRRQTAVYLIHGEWSHASPPTAASCRGRVGQNGRHVPGYSTHDVDVPVRNLHGHADWYSIALSDSLAVRSLHSHLRGPAGLSAPVRSRPKWISPPMPRNPRAIT